MIGAIIGYVSVFIVAECCAYKFFAKGKKALGIASLSAFALLSLVLLAISR